MNRTEHYLTRDGDVLDAIALRLCGSEHALHALLQLNPHLARWPAILPAGLRVRLPPAQVAPRRVQRVRLWTSPT